MPDTGKGQLVSCGDAGLAIWKCRRFPAVLTGLSFSWKQNRDSNYCVMDFRLCNIEHYLREYSWACHFCVFITNSGT